MYLYSCCCIPTLLLNRRGGGPEWSRAILSLSCSSGVSTSDQLNFYISILSLKRRLLIWTLTCQLTLFYSQITIHLGQIITIDQSTIVIPCYPLNDLHIMVYLFQSYYFFCGWFCHWYGKNWLYSLFRLDLHQIYISFCRLAYQLDFLWYPSSAQDVD